MPDGTRRVRRSAGLALLVLGAGCAGTPPPPSPPAVATPILIAHRGASGYRPEHTLEAYALAIEMGADFIEPDLVITRDGVLIARHEPYLGGDNPEFAGADSTDVSGRPEFADRKRTVVLDGVTLRGWFAQDFTLAEIRTLRAKERLPALRPASATHDGRYGVPTLAEIIALARAAEARTGRAIGIYPETKHPSFFRALGLPLEERLVRELGAAGYDRQPERVFIQSFEVANLQYLDRITDLPLVQLIGASGGPWDFRASGDARGYDYLLTPEGLRFIAGYADAIGPEKGRIIPRLPGETGLGAPTGLVAAAHAAGLKVHAWTFRSENRFLPMSLRRGENPAATGDHGAEYRAFIAAGVDGLFCDQPDHARAALTAVPPAR